MAKKSTTFKGQVKPYGKSGHFHESRRHSLQAKGVKTGNLSKGIPLYSKRQKIISDAEKSFIQEDKAEPFTNREYVGETKRIFSFLKDPYGDLEDPRDRATYDVVNDILRETTKDTDGDGVSDAEDCEPLDPTQQDRPVTFKITDDVEIVCQWKDTKRGFKHVATLYVDGEPIEDTSVSYLNRTWESYEFQTVMQKLVDKTDALTPDQKEQVQEYLKQNHTDWSGFKMVGAIAELGNVFGKTKAEKNDWKEKMVKAGLGDMGLQMPDDWETLSEDEKEKRLDKVIKLAKATGDNLNAPPTHELPSGHEYELEPRYDSAKSFYGKANVRQEDGKTVLRSYSTDVAYIEDGKPHVKGTYSHTTTRHIKEFLKQHGFDVESTKQMMKKYGGE